MQSVTILNSRQNLRPIGSNSWIKNTKSAMQKLSGKNVVVLTSVGMKTWELLVYLAAKHKIMQRIYVPITRDQKNIDVIVYYTKQFRLSPKLTDWYFLEIEDLKKDNHFFQKERDRLIIKSADIIYPISIRQNSTLKQLYSSVNNSQVVVDKQLMIAYDKSVKFYKYKIDKDKLNIKIDNQLKNYLIHWTRTANNPWPGELLYDYYNLMANSKNEYCHSAYLTLKRILSEKKLTASSRHYRRGFSAVAFSQLPPSEAINLMKWRARYSGMSFEPYGIAIRKRIAEKIGIRKVIYGDNKLFKNLDLIDRPYFQPIGTKGYWKPEKEWRHLADIDLSEINSDDLKIIVWKKEQFDFLKKYSESDIISICK